MSRLVRAYCDDATEWIDNLDVGDILLEKGKTPRVVRSVSRYPSGDRYGRDGFVRSITLTIKRCSWVKRCYTVISRSDIKQRGFVPTGKRKTDITTLDKFIALDITKRARDKRLDCCDVRGIA